MFLGLSIWSTSSTFHRYRFIQVGLVFYRETRTIHWYWGNVITKYGTPGLIGQGHYIKDNLSTDPHQDYNKIWSLSGSLFGRSLSRLLQLTCRNTLRSVSTQTFCDPNVTTEVESKGIFKSLSELRGRLHIVRLVFGKFI